MKIVRPGGIVLIGDGYWRSRPSEDYLKRLGGTIDEMNFHHENLELIEKYGMTPLWASTASLDDWDHYEWSYSKAIEDFSLKNPEHPQVDEFRAKIKNWRHCVWNGGRDYMGFALYTMRV